MRSAFALTLLAACSRGAGGAPLPTTCRWQGEVHVQGEVWSGPAGESCTCAPPAAEAVCTPPPPVSCPWMGGTVDPGWTFPSPDGCNTCWCDEQSGQVLCTLIGCLCHQLGFSTLVGTSYLALDGCNTCTCLAQDQPSCTELPCVCDPPSEWWLSYASAEPAGCADTVCPAYTAPFQNACGCGCAQTPNHCKPTRPCDDVWTAEICPFSKPDCP